jgi:hypothetical protein
VTRPGFHALNREEGRGPIRSGTFVALLGRARCRADLSRAEDCLDVLRERAEHVRGPKRARDDGGYVQ